jgi:hypothetical protein
MIHAVSLACGGRKQHHNAYRRSINRLNRWFPNRALLLREKALGKRACPHQVYAKIFVCARLANLAVLER